jgi:hypothetical protein
VYDFVKDKVEVMPWYRRTTPFDGNGSRQPEGWGSNALYQNPTTKRVKDIAQPGVEPNVYDFVKDKVEAIPWYRRTTPFEANGSRQPEGWGSNALYQNPTTKRVKDIAEPAVDEKVYHFTRDQVETLPWVRTETAYAPNGS